jgi:hypothetical protein
LVTGDWSFPAGASRQGSNQTAATQKRGIAAKRHKKRKKGKAVKVQRMHDRRRRLERNQDHVSDFSGFGFCAFCAFLRLFVLAVGWLAIRNGRAEHVGIPVLGSFRAFLAFGACQTERLD